MTTDITELAQSHELRNKVNHRLYGALEFQGTSGENATIALSIDECKSIIAAMDERIALVEALELKEEQRANWFQMAQKLGEDLDAAEKRIAELESRTVTPVTYSENADADYCRKWAWGQVKGEVSTEDWTTGDNITYFGFFCWGWDMRRQYNEQRPVTVKLLDCDLAAVQHMSGGSKDYCNGFVDGTQNAIRAMRAAGVDVKEAE